MGVSGTGVRHDDLAHQLFSVITRVCLTLPRGRRRGGELKDLEFLTLAILRQHGTMIVGDIQRILGVLPAQMSRIIRSLESRPRPLILCRINPQDKRKIDVSLTPAGDRALLEYQALRITGIADLLARLPEDDLDDLQRLLDRLNEAAHPHLNGEHAR
jgi:DNA-binding MarR family transcriptional regulator